MKKLLCIISILLALALSFQALGEDFFSDTSQDSFERALSYLNSYGGILISDNVSYALNDVTLSASAGGFRQQYIDYLSALLLIHDAGYSFSAVTPETIAAQKLPLLVKALNLLGRLKDDNEFAADLGARNLPLPEKLITYINGLVYETRGSVSEAIEAFEAVRGIFDAAARADRLYDQGIQATFNRAMELFNQGSYAKAAEIFLSLGFYVDEDGVFAEDMYNESRYQQCVQLYEAKEYWKAAQAFSKMGGYKDSAEIARKALELHNRNHPWRAATCTSAKTCPECGATEGRPLGHDWTMATCTKPKTCKRCGATEGRALGHDWKAATCTSPKTCKRCGATEGRALGHDWKAATCTSPKTCRRCGATEGSALGHNWKASTCTSPKTCIRCGATEGSALGHDWKAATRYAPETCARCGLTRGEKLTELNIGEHVTFGRYEQDNNTSNDKEAIEWIVLDKNNKGEYLLISRYALDCQTYHTSKSSVSWETCSLRTWLNRTFLNAAFDSAEQNKIITATVNNSQSQCYSGWKTSGGYNTTDKVFLLSYAQANKYLGVKNYSTASGGNNTGARTGATEYAKSRGASVNAAYKTTEGAASCNWWLRSPGSNLNSAAIVGSSGFLDNNSVNSTSYAVRPAIWVSLSGSEVSAKSTASSPKANRTPTPKPTASTKASALSSSAKVGDHVTFGHYEQDNKTSNGKEAIEWIVLSKTSKGEYLLLSKYCLDAQPYNKTNTKVTWENSTLRSWLNKDFYSAAFDSTEQKKIITATIGNGESHCYSGWKASGGNNTKDKVFLLSYWQANNYLGVMLFNENRTGTNMESRTSATPYAEARGASSSGMYKTDEGAASCNWWLRSPGNTQDLAAYVSFVGSLSGKAVNTRDYAVRPVIWVKP